MMKFALERHGTWILLTINEAPSAVMGIWETVAEEVEQVTIKRAVNCVKVNGPISHALWAVYLFLKLMLEYGPSLGYEMNEERAMQEFGSTVEEIRAVRGW